MARHASTYRKARRSEWINSGSGMTWAEYNAARKAEYGSKLYGPVRSAYIGSLPKPSKDYRGKLGAKDQERKAKATSPVLSA